ncbi:MgtC/SapB family protein [Lysobacter cavernae]|uniref:MgtC/SapB family protein n=1 Tax=Lysobacter cavernae TaxID=1685901 RepID=A0ABV7RKV3_9GAMM
MPFTLVLQGLLTAIAIGLLIGVVRERHHHGDTVAVAGVRTHTLIAICAAVAIGFGTAAFIALLLAVAALALGGYLRTRATDPGLTGETALLATALLAALAQRDAALAGGLGVTVAILLFAKRPLQRFARDIVSEHEVQDALLLAASALIVLPMLPDTAIDPWGVLVPSKLWQLVVLVMAVGMLGHIALRSVGGRWGLPVAGFFSGFASSTAAVAGFGQRSRDEPTLTGSAASAAILANLASLALFAGIIGTAAPALLRAGAWPLAAAALVLAITALVGLHRHQTAPSLPKEPSARAFRLSHALLLAALIAAVLVVSAWLRSLFGDAGALIAAMLVALAELHAAAASVAQLSAAGDLSLDHARLGVAGLLTASAIAKTVLAFASGSRRYAFEVGAGLIGMAVACALVTLLTR